MPSENAAPVSLGSPRFKMIECGAFQVTEAFFPAGHKIQKHFHNRAVVGLTRAGEWDSILGGTRLANTPCTLHVEPAGDSHENKFTTDTYVTIIQPDSTDDRLTVFKSLLETGSQLSVGMHGVLIAEQLCKELASHDDLTPLAIESLSLELLVLSFRADRCQNSARPRWLSRAIEYLHSRFLDRPTLGELCNISGVSPAHFNREFRRRYRVSASEYVRGLRLDWAAERLRSGTESLAEIASTAGFSDQSHFTRHFRRKFGATPAAFRGCFR